MAAYDSPAHARTRKEDPMLSRPELADKALHIHDVALEHMKSYTNKDGEVRDVEAPDFRAALEALKFIAQLAGYTGRIEDWNLPDVERQLKRIGLRVVKDGGNGKAA